MLTDCSSGSILPPNKLSFPKLPSGPGFDAYGSYSVPSSVRTNCMATLRKAKERRFKFVSTIHDVHPTHWRDWEQAHYRFSLLPCLMCYR
jgi:hypothetical protein